MTKIHIDVPNHFQTELSPLLFVVDRGSTYDAIELLHEESPITPLEHREATVIEAIGQCFWRFFAKFYRKVLLAFAEVFALIEDVIVNFGHIGLTLIWRSEYPFQTPSTRRLLTLSGLYLFFHHPYINQSLLEYLVQSLPLIEIFA